MVQGFASTVCDANKQVKSIISGFETFIEKIKKISTNRKDQAQKIIESYGSTGRTNILFTILDGKHIVENQLLKLFHLN
jgi:hypothetical protein